MILYNEIFFFFEGERDLIPGESNACTSKIWFCPLEFVCKSNADRYLFTSDVNHPLSNDKKGFYEFFFIPWLKQFRLLLKWMLW